MRKIKAAACLLMAMLFIFPMRGQVYAENEPYVKLNGQRLEIDARPQTVNGRYMLPLRYICDALGIAVHWDADTSVVYMLRRGVAAYHRAGSKQLRINDETKQFDTPSLIIDDRIYMPLTMLDIMVDAKISIDSAEKCVSIDYAFDYHKLSVGGKSIKLGQSVDELKKIFGEPDRVSPSPIGCNWFVYNSAYENFIIIGVENGLVRAFYSNAKSFVYNDEFSHGKIYEELSGDGQVKFFTEAHDNNSLYAVFVNSCADKAAEYLVDAERYRESEERLLADITNAYRAGYGKSALKYDEEAAAASRAHSGDMAQNGFFSHISLSGKTPIERLIKANIFFSAYGENLAAGNSNAILCFDQWVKAEGHRENMLVDNYHFIGIGIAVKPGSEYKFYYTQTFLTK